MEIRVDQGMLNDVLSAVGDIKNGYKKVLVTSINKTLGTVKTQATARIGNEINLTAARIKKDMTIQKANYSKISGALNVTGEPVGLVQFGASQTKKGVTVKVLRSSAMKLLKHAMIAAGRSSSTTQHVFWRQYDGPRKPFVPGKKYGVLPKEYRLPLERLTGPRIEDILAKDTVLDPVTIQANTVFASNVSTKIDEVLRRHG